MSRNLEAEYIAHNVSEASYLYANGGRLLGISGSFHRPKFCFDDKDRHAQRMAADYFSDATTPARTLMTALADLRQELKRVFPPAGVAARH
jgi:hypothetical protein